MKKSLQSLVLLLMALMVPMTATAAYEQLADGVYQDGSTLYISSSVTSLGDLQVNPSEIYCYATIPPACVSNTFSGYGATLHVPAAGMVSYFTALYWYNFNNILSDAIEPLSLTMNTTEYELEIGQQFSLSATVAPGDATPKTVCWSSSDSSVATVSGGGIVTALAAGECDIFARCVDKVALCHVTVVLPRVTITLDKHEARLLPNHTLTLTATCSPIDVDLAVTSSNPGVAIPRLVNGTIMVVGVAEGTATITVNAADGWGNPDSCEVTVYTDHGDVNCDGYVNISDVTALIDYLLSGNPSGVNLTGADCNNDNNINISDVTTLIDYLLSGKWSWEQSITYTVNGVSFKMVPVEGGTFMMGATAEQGNDAFEGEKPAHQVTLSSFSIGETEVTQALWQAVMGSNPSRNTGDLQRPVENVSWNDCQTFIFKLNELTDKTFRLPTEAEWEHAARGGKRSQGYKYAGSNDVNEVAWSLDNSSNGTKPVATKAPNELGLYDMCGNVWEWVQDWYSSYSSESQTNPMGPASGNCRVYCGGSWFYRARSCRVSCRSGNYQTGKGGDVGLRLALDPDNSTKFRLSETVLTVMLDENKLVNMLNGDGYYTIEGGLDNVTCTINDNSLTVTGTQEGTTTVHVTNTSTGATAVLTVIVVDGHECIDLGLSSGTLWATMNIGASTPEDYGDYFAWGETAPKDHYDWSNYKWFNGSDHTLAKYCTDNDYDYNGFVDNKTELDPEDDAAYVNWGPSWRMPSYEQQDELREECIWTCTTRNGINGILATGPNGNSIFLPAAGCCYDDYGNPFACELWGYYWSRTLWPIKPGCAYTQDFDFESGGDVDNLGFGRLKRDYGLTIRAVRMPQN